MAREVLTLSKYDIEIHYIKGKANGRADTLSQQPDYDRGNSDNQDVTVLPDKIFVHATTESIVDNTCVLSKETVSVQEMTIEHPVYEQDEAVLKPWINTHGLKKVQGTWYKDGRWVVTGGLHYKRLIIQAHHDPPVYGHPGINCTNQLVTCYYWWPGIQQEVKEYVQGCVDCQ